MLTAILVFVFISAGCALPADEGGNAGRKRRKVPLTEDEMEQLGGIESN